MHYFKNLINVDVKKMLLKHFYYFEITIIDRIVQ